MRNLSVPLIHLNGTSARTLLEDLETAHSRIAEAQLNLAQCAPNMRDFYPKSNGDEEFRKAQKEHYARIQKLRDVCLELSEIVEAIYTQGAL